VVVRFWVVVKVFWVVVKVFSWSLRCLGGC